MADALLGQGTHRPASLHSVASNSSVASGVSLTRRARTKTRPKTAGSSGRADKLSESPISELPHIDIDFVLEPSEGLLSTIAAEPLSLPPRSHRDEAVEIQNDNTSSRAEGRVVVRDGILEHSQMPPVTTRLVRIRT